MPRSRPLALAAAVVALVAPPAGALAADGVAQPDAPTIVGAIEVTGVAQLPDGTPVADVTVTALVVGSDVISQAVTGADGGFTLAVDAIVGDVVEFGGVGPLVAVGTPTPEGCQARRAVTGRLELTIADEPPGSVTLVLDGALDSEVCTATATPAVTPPATDAGDGPTPHGTGIATVAGLLALLGGGALVAAGRRAAARSAVR